MNRYLLLILLFSWSLLATNSHECDTGVAKRNSELGLSQSLMTNADVAILKKYEVKTFEKCLEDCCVKKFGNCNVATYRKNATKENCLHFYCLPLNKCIFMSSISSDSFSFSSSALVSHPVPSINNDLKNNSVSEIINLKPKPVKRPTSVLQHEFDEHELTKEKIVTYSEEQFAFKNDNTTVKPRKGVEDPDDIFEINATTRSGVKPRKGVTMDDVSHQEYLLKNAKSKVKPRKGVGPYNETNSSIDFSVYSSSSIQIIPTVTNKNLVKQTSMPVHNKYGNILSYDLISALEKVFEDDPHADISSNSTRHESTTSIAVTNTQAVVEPSSHSTLYPPYKNEVSSSALLSSYSLSHDNSEPTSKHTPSLKISSSSNTMAATYFDYSLAPTSISDVVPTRSVVISSEVYEVSSAPSLPILEQEMDDEETENERRYKSSMHLVLSLVFGLLVLFAVLGVVAKRIYDGWLRRHYRRMDFLIDGMYNGYN